MMILSLEFIIFFWWSLPFYNFCQQNSNWHSNFQFVHVCQWQICCNSYLQESTCYVLSREIKILWMINMWYWCVLGSSATSRGDRWDFRYNILQQGCISDQNVTSVCGWSGKSLSRFHFSLQYWYISKTEIVRLIKKRNQSKSNFLLKSQKWENVGKRFLLSLQLTL